MADRKTPKVKPERQSDPIGWALWMRSKNGEYPKSLTGSEKDLLCMTAQLEGWTI